MITNTQNDRELLISLIKYTRGFRVGKDLGLAEAAIRRERQLQAELDNLPPPAVAEHAGQHAAA